MNVFKPSYYDEFKCIASRCKHSCCIGWEIDVDDDKYEEYMKKDGDFGDRLRENITEGEERHFILKEGDRCPFLNCDNLCDIIINMGEGALCQICRDHPRFVNCFSDRDEVGIGMCCEEAARIILTNKDKTEIVGDDCPDDEEAVFFNFRKQVFGILQDREWTIDERIENVCALYGLCLPERDWYRIYAELERLDDSWNEKLELLKSDEKELTSNWETEFEQILVYFVYRHLSEGFYDGRVKERLLFAILSLYIIRKIFSQEKETVEELVEVCRMYSSEVEYSEENIESLLNKLSD